LDPFSHTLSATIGPLVALVSAAICGHGHGQVSFPERSDFEVVPEAMATYHNAIIVNTSDDCCTGASGFGKRNPLGVKSRVAVVVGEVEARHRYNAGCVHTTEVRMEIRQG